MWLVTSDGIMASLLKKLQISIKIHVVKLLWSLFGLQLSTDSVGGRRELVANSVHCSHRRRDSTRQLSRVGVGGVYVYVKPLSRVG